MIDPQEDKTYRCRACCGTGKSQADREETEAHYTANPDEHYPGWEEHIEVCDECQGEGFIYPDDQEDEPDPDFIRDQQNDIKNIL